MRQFRTLRADEIECRIGTSSDKGCSLLLYKTARTDYALLDEVIGAMDWQCRYEVISGTMYCGIGIYNAARSEWIWKWNAGSESNTEAEKGQASDALKRAGFAWGIGTELYSSPFIWVPHEKCKVDSKGRIVNTFSVGTIEYDNSENISHLTIVDTRSGEIVYTYGRPAEKAAPKATSSVRMSAPVPATVACDDCGEPIKPVSVGGKMLTAMQIMARTQKRYGRCLCARCAAEAAKATKVEKQTA